MLLVVKCALLLKNLYQTLPMDALLFTKINLICKTNLIFKKKLGLTKVFKSIFRLDAGLSKDNIVKLKIFSKKNSTSTWNKELFKVFLHLNTWVLTPTLRVHASFNIFYLYNSQSNVGYFNLKRIFKAWNNIIIFITNIFYYNLNHLVFGSSYFKYEVLSLNWTSLNFTKFLWRFSHSFIFFLKNKTTLNNRLYFNYLNYLNFKIAFIVDIYYHNRTIYYFNRSRAITIGPVPVSSNYYTLSISLPVSSNLNFSNLFFLRLIFKLKKNNAKLLFEDYNKV